MAAPSAEFITNLASSIGPCKKQWANVATWGAGHAITLFEVFMKRVSDIARPFLDIY